MSSVLLVRQRTLRQLRPVPRTAEIVEQVSSLKAAGFLRLRLGAQTKSSVGHTDAVRRCQFGWPFPRTAHSGSAARRGGGEYKTPRVSRRPRRGEAEPRRARRYRKRLRQFPPRGCCPWPLSPFPSGDGPSSPTNAWLDDGLILPQLSEEFGRFPRRTAVQWSRTGRAAARFSAHCRPARMTPCASGRRDSVDLLRPRSPNLAVLANQAAPLVPAYLHHAAQRGDPLPDLEIGERPSRSIPSLAKAANAPNALAVAAPFSTMDAKVRTAPAAAGESFERDKP